MAQLENEIEKLKLLVQRKGHAYQGKRAMENSQKVMMHKRRPDTSVKRTNYN